MPDDVLMPDGARFEFWDDRTRYARVYHVAREHPSASDENPGTQDAPFATIGRAAELLRPGEKVVVHAGTYRECVRPARGGEGPDRMIAYEAAPGDDVCVKGSEVWEAPFEPGAGWRLLQPGLPETESAEARPPVWTAELPPEWFVGYNPFVADNMSAEFTTFVNDWTPEETRRMQLRRGGVFADGVPLRQVFRYRDLRHADGAFWVEDPGLRLHLRLPGDADPNAACLEVTAREQVFAPVVRGLAYVRVKGFRFEHAADGVPVPQRACVSALRGHHWIVEDCRIRWANACGLDVGNETWHALGRDGEGRHVIRRNVISDCGVCGIAGVHNVRGALVEDNRIERIGGLDIERIWETGGLKFHGADGVLIRRNLFRNIRHAPGLWLDYLNRNSRVTGNLFTDIESILGGVYLEVSHETNVIDGNVFWDIRGAPHADGTHHYSGPAVNVDTGENAVVAHNLVARVPDAHGVRVHLNQAARLVGGRNGLCRRQQVLNNIIVACRGRVFWGRADENQADGNLYDSREDREAFEIAHPEPRVVLNLQAWRDYYGFDRRGAQAAVDVHFDDERLALTVNVTGDMPDCPAVEIIGSPAGARPGPLNLAWETTDSGARATLQFRGLDDAGRQT